VFKTKHLVSFVPCIQPWYMTRASSFTPEPTLSEQVTNESTAKTRTAWISIRGKSTKQFFASSSSSPIQPTWLEPVANPLLNKYYIVRAVSVLSDCTAYLPELALTHSPNHITIIRRFLIKTSSCNYMLGQYSQIPERFD